LQLSLYVVSLPGAVFLHRTPALKANGMSNREIALGVDHQTIANDLKAATGENSPPNRPDPVSEAQQAAEAEAADVEQEKRETLPRRGLSKRRRRIPLHSGSASLALTPRFPKIGRSFRQGAHNFGPPPAAPGAPPYRVPGPRPLRGPLRARASSAGDP
jgi:hypothetical protein